MSQDEFIVEAVTEEVTVIVAKPPEIDVTVKSAPDVIILATGGLGLQGPQGQTGPQGPDGAPGGGTIQGNWNWQVNPISAPFGTPGRIGVNTDTPGTATQLWVQRLDSGGTDYGNTIGDLAVDDLVFIQQKNLATAWIRYRVTGAAVLNGSTWVIPVAVESGAQGLEPGPNTSTLVAFEYLPPPGPQGPKGDKGDKGDVGATGATGTIPARLSDPPGMTQNLDTCDSTGWYYFGPTTVGRPGDWYGMVQVYAYPGALNTTQILYLHGSQDVFYRTKAAGASAPWHHIFDGNGNLCAGVNTQEWVSAAGMQANSEGLWSQRDVATKVAFAAWVGAGGSADAFDRWEALANGQLQWGDGAHSPDTNLYRPGPGVLRTDGELYVGSDFVAMAGQSGQIFIPPYAAPTIEFGPARDTNIFRAAAGVLQTSSKFNAVGGLQSNGVDVAPLPARLGPSSQQVSDANQAIQDGWYNAPAGSANNPTADSHYHLRSMSVTGNGYVRQEAYALYDQRSFVRFMFDPGNWGAWYTLMDANGQIGEATVPRRLAIGTQLGGITVADWNLAVNSGWYDGNSATNSPVAGWLMGEVIAHRGSGASIYITQRVWTFVDGSAAAQRQSWQRQCVNGVWQAWVSLVYPTGTAGSPWTTGDTKISAQTATHADPLGGTWFLADGSAIPGGNAPLVAILGANLPDARGRGLVMVGTHADVNAVGKNEGIPTVANRRPKHQTSKTDPGHIHQTYGSRGSGGNNSLDYGVTYTGPDSQMIVAAQTGISVGSGVGTDPIDQPSFVVAGNLFYHS